MRDLKRHRAALASICRIREAQRTGLRQQLQDANDVLRQATQERALADEGVDLANGAWHSSIGSGSYHPELVRALGDALVRSVSTRVAAEEVERGATKGREACADSFLEGEARCRQVEKAFRETCRDLARARDERVLERLADRSSYNWRRA